MNGNKIQYTALQLLSILFTICIWPQHLFSNSASIFSCSLSPFPSCSSSLSPSYSNTSSCNSVFKIVLQCYAHQKANLTPIYGVEALTSDLTDTMCFHMCIPSQVIAN